jgi:transcriptional regulator with XRE-family HTH domain
MYRLKRNKIKYIKSQIKTQKELAERIGIDESYVSQMFNGRDVSKLCAYATTKATSSVLEIADLFDYTEE